MSKKVLVNLDLNQNQIQNAVAQVLATAPAKPVEGQYYWNSVVKAWMIYNGTGWQQSGSDYNLPPASSTALGGIMASDSIAVDEDTGVATVVDNGHKHTASNITDFANSVKSATGDSFVGVSYNSTNGVITFTNRDGTTDTVDLPLELLIESGSYNSTTKNIELVLANGSKIEIPAGDMVSEYNADGTTLELDESTNTFSVKDGVYQGKLTFDGTPTDNSSNPVTSDGIHAALANKQATLNTAQLSAVNSGITSSLVTQINTNKSSISTLQTDKQDALTSVQLSAVNSGVSYSSVRQINTNKTDISNLQTAVSNKQDTLTFDNSPTRGSSNPVTSDGIVTALSSKSEIIQVENSELTPSGGVCTWTIHLSEMFYRPLWSNVTVLQVSDGQEVICGVTYNGDVIVISINSTSTITAGTYRAVIVCLKDTNF